VVEAIPKALERIPDDQGEFVRKWLRLLSEEYEAPFALGLLERSIAIATPVGEQCFDILDVDLCAGELLPVTRQ